MKNKKFIALAIAGIMSSAVFLSGCSGEQGPKGENGADGSTWLSGVTTPQATEGKAGDFYYDTDDYILYKKTESEWVVLMNNFGKGETGSQGKTGPQGEAGKDGATPTVGENLNWWINGEDTGYKAIGTDGKSTTIAITDDGYWEIDGEKTSYLAYCSNDELKSQLSGVLELCGNTTFESTYIPYEKVDEYTSLWSNTTSTFSGWGGLIGKPTNFNAIWFKVRARGVAITKIRLYLAEGDKNGEILFDEVMDVDIKPYQEQEIVWNLPEALANSKNINYYFAYACNALSDRNGMVNEYTRLPQNEDQAMMGYYVNGSINEELSGITLAKGQDAYYSYMTVKCGTSTPTYRLKSGAIEELLKETNAITYTNTSLALPNTIYGFAEQTLKIYFENIMPYKASDVNILVTSGSRGNIYSDRWEYTPTTAETFSLTFEIYSLNYDLLGKTTYTVEIKDSTTNSDLKVLVIGDSTVNAGVETAKMVELSEADEDFNLTLLGTKGTDANLHEGRGGWTSKLYVNSESAGTDTNPFYNPDTETFDFAYYMTANSYESVDVVFLQLGINDMFSATATGIDDSIDTFITNLDLMIQSIHAYNADIQVVINLIIPCQLDQDKFTSVYGMTQTAWGAKRNFYFANLELLDRYENSSNVYLSWYNACLDAYNEQKNDVHPSTEGYNTLGTQMYYFLKAIS